MTLLTNLRGFYEKASPKTKEKLLSSILAEKLELKGKKYRTPTLKPGFNHIFHSINQLQKQRKKKGEPFSELSRLVPGAGLEPARPFGSTDFKSVVSTNSTIRAWIGPSATKVSFHQRLKTSASRFSRKPHVGLPTTLFQLAQIDGSSRHLQATPLSDRRHLRPSTLQGLPAHGLRGRRPGRDR